MDAVYAHLIGFGVFASVTACMGVIIWAAWSLLKQAIDDLREGPAR